MAEDISTDLANVDELGIDTVKAVDAVKMSNAKGIDPVDAYDNLETFKAADKVTKPVLAPPGVTEYAQRSPSHAAVIKQDREQLGMVEKIFGGSFAAATSIPKQAESNRLSHTLMNRRFSENGAIANFVDDYPELTNEQVAEKIVSLNEELGNIPNYDDENDSDFSPAKIIPGLVGVATQIIDSTVEHGGKVAAAAGTGAVIGGGAGLLAGGVGAIPGAIGTASTLGFMAMNAANVYDTFKQTSGDIFQYGMNLEKRDEIYKDDKELYYLALGGGMVSGAIEGVMLGSLGKIVRWGARLGAGTTAGKAVGKAMGGVGEAFTKKGMFEMIKKNPAVKNYILELGKRAAVGGLGEASQELVKIYTENLAAGKTLNPFKIIEENAQRLLDNLIIGAAVPIAVGGVTARRNIRNAKAADAKSPTTKTTKNVVTPPVAVDGVPTITNDESGINQTQVDEATPSTVEDFELDDGTIDEDFESSTMVELNEKDSKKVQRQQKFMAQFQQVREVLESTKVKDDPEVQADVINAISKDSQVYIDAQAVRDMGEKNVAAFEKITGTKLTDADKETILVPYSKAIELAQQNLEFDGIIRGEADGISLNDVDKLNNHIKENAEKINNVTTALGVETITEVERAIKVSELRGLTHPDDVAMDPESYINDPAVPENMRESYPEGEAESLNNTVKDVRSKIVEANNEAKKSEIDHMVDLATETELVLEKEKIEQQLREDTTSDTVRKFEDGGSVDSGTLVRLRMLGFNPDNITDNHTRDGFSILAIDPKTLPPELASLAKDPKLKAMGVFVKGGIPLNVANDAIGKFKTGKDLLSHLIANQTIEQKRQRLGELTEREVRARNEAEIGVTERDYLDAHEAMADANVKEINTILREKTGEAKRLIRRLGKILPTTDSLKAKAASIASNLKVSELNADIYRRNANYARAQAATALTSGNWESFVTFKEREALNNMLIKQVSKQNRTINNNIKKIAKMNTKESAQAIRNMPVDVQQTINEMLGMIEYNPRKKSVDRSTYMKTIEALASMGEVDISMDSQFLDNGKTYINDMPYDQANAITQFVVDAFYIQRDMDYMKKAGAEAKENQKIKQVTDALSEQLVDRAGFDAKAKQEFKEGRVEINEKEKTTRDRIRRVFGKVSTSIDIFSFLIKKMDNNVFNGLLAKHIYNPLDAGQVEHGKFTNSHELQTVLQAEAYGRDFKEINNVEVNVEELSHTRFKGKVGKVQLLNMAAYMGTESSITRMESDLGMDRKAILVMLGKNLDKRDFELVQKKVDFYETSVKEKNTAMLKASRGDMPKYIDAVPITVTTKDGHTVTMKGGYFPLTYSNPINKKLERRVKDQAQLQREIQVKQKAESMTENGRNKERADNVDRPLSYEFFVNDRVAVTDFSRDIHLRIPLRNISKIFGDQNFMANVVGTIGIESTDEMVSSLVHLAGNDQSSSIQLDRNMQSILDAHRGKFSLYALGYNLGTVAKQAVSLPVVYGNLINNARDKKMKTLVTYASTLMGFIGSPLQSRDAIKAIADMDPEMFDKLRQWNAGLNPIDTMSAMVGRVVDAPNIYSDTSQNPDGGKSKAGKVVKGTKNAVGSAISLGMKGLAGAAIGLNASAYVAAYKSAMAGDVKNVGADHKAAMQYARTIVQMSLESNSPLDTAAVFRAKGAISLFSNFYRQPLIQFKNVQSSVSEAMEGYRQNQTWAEHTETSGRLASQMLWYAVLPNLALRAIDQVRGYGDQDEDKDLLEKGLGAVFSWKTLFSPVDNVLLARDVTYGIGNDRKIITNPLFDTINTGYRMLKDLTSVVIDGKEVTRGMVKNVIKGGSIAAGLPNAIMKRITAQSEESAQSGDSGVNLGGTDDVGILDYVASMPDQLMELLSSPVGRSEVKEELTYLKGTPEYEALSQEQKDAIDLIDQQVETVTFRTNPEMDKISAHNGEINLTPAQVDDYKIYMQAISNLETMNQTQFGNATSSAAGYFHIINSTWDDIVRHYPDLGLPGDVRDANRNQQFQAMWRVMGEYTNDINAAGGKIDGVNLYLRHMMGPGAYSRFMKASDDATSDKFLSGDAQDQNPGIVGTTKARTLRNTARLLEPYLARAYDQLEKEKASPAN